MGNNMVSCDLKRQLVYSYHLITKFLCHLWEATQANVSSHLIMKRKNRQNVLEKQTALITPSQCSLRIWKKALCRQVLYIKKYPVLKTFFFKKSGLMPSFSHVQLRAETNVWLRLRGNLGNRLARKINSTITIYSPLFIC